MTKRSLKSNRRNFLGGSAAAVTTFFIAGRGWAQTPYYTLKFATVATSDSPWGDHTKKFKRRVQQGSLNRVKVKTMFGEPEVESIGRVKDGSIAIWGGTAGALASVVPEIAAIELPYLWPSRKAADDLLDTKVKSVIETMLDKHGYKLLFYSENGWRSIGTKFGFVTDKQSLQHKKIRVQQHPVHINTMAAMGGTPTPMSVPDTMTSLQTNVVDGFDNTPLFAMATGWAGEISHFSFTKHSYQPGFAIVSKSVFKTLPMDIKALIMGDPLDEAKYARRKIRAMDKIIEVQLEDTSGYAVQIYKPSKAERLEFAKKTISTHKKFTAKYGKTFYNAMIKHL
jgi:TRAP-type C4-dicarboxylate transport system substrate-binding protein